MVKILHSAVHRDKWTDCCTVSCGTLTFLVTTVKFERQQKVEKCQCLVLLPFSFIVLRPEIQSRNLQFLSNITNHRVLELYSSYPTCWCPYGSSSHSCRIILIYCKKQKGEYTGLWILLYLACKTISFVLPSLSTTIKLLYNRKSKHPTWDLL